MSVTIPAHPALGVAQKEYTVVDGVIHNVRLWPGSDGRTTLRLRKETGNSEETLDQFVLHVPREVTQMRVRALSTDAGSASLPCCSLSCLCALRTRGGAPEVLRAGARVPHVAGRRQIRR